MTNEPGTGIARGCCAGSVPRRQRGVVLLALILVVLAGSSYVLLGKLNERAQAYARDVQTQTALKQAKQALIQYAVSYPELHEDSGRIPGPGYLPCPDQDPGPHSNSDPHANPGPDPAHVEDMVGQTNCAESTGTTVGLLPTRDLGLDNLVDAAGERLWYTVAQEFKQNQNATHVLNSETPASLRVDGADEEIVAIVIAPGAPVGEQDGRGEAVQELYADPNPTKSWHEVVAEYLEDENATNGDGAFVTGSTVADSPPQCTDGSLDDEEVELQCFNDSLITITRRELMAAVEARVANDARAALDGYRTLAGGAFPWLVPFTDPKRDGRLGVSQGGYGLSGRHTSSTSSSTLLTDANADFVSAGVGVGDRLWNVTDGSYGTVAAVTATTLTVTGLAGGTANNFTEDDIYYVEAAALATGVLFDGSAGAGSGGTTLEAAADLEAFGVVAGDVVDEIDTVTKNVIASGRVVSVDGVDVELDPDSSVDFQPGDAYRVRSAIGVASAASAANSLEDVDVNFTAAGVAAGDLVRNLTDGSQGMVATVGIPDDNTLTVASLYGGTDNDFDVGDSYALVRHLPESGTRYGLLPVHEYGKPFLTEFSVQWSLTNANGITVLPWVLATDMPADTATTYFNAVKNWIQGSANYSDSTGTDTSYPDAVTADSNVACIWAGLNIAHCSGKYVDTAFLTATAETVSLSGSIYTLTDTGTRFNYAGVRPGAKIRNVSQGLDGIVYNATNTTTTRNQVQAVAVDNGGTPFTATTGDEIRVWVATKRTPATGSHVADGATGANQVCTAGANFWSFVGAGDTIRLNSTTYGNPVGLITGAPTADCVTYTDLQGGSATSISLGQGYRIQYDFVEERQWQFRVQMAGTSVIAEPSATAGVMQRSVCRGFGSTCASQSAAAVYVADNTNPVIQFTDVDSGGNQLGTASLTVPAAGAALGSLLVSGLNLDMVADTDVDTDDGNLPRWFLQNRWQEYVFASYADALNPTQIAANPSGDCVAGTDCLSVEVQVPLGAVHNDRRAVVLIAGAELSSQDRSASGAAVSDYFEDENAEADTDTTLPYSVFDRADVDDTFNDQLSAVTP